MITFDFSFQLLANFYSSALMMGVLVLFLSILFLSVIIQKYPHSKISFLFEYLYEQVFIFYESILGKNNKLWIKTFVITLFFLIFFANILGILRDFIAPVFGTNLMGNFILAELIQIPSADLHFNIALALSSIALLLCIQFSSLGTKGFFSHYFPIFGKGYMTLERGSLRNMYFYILFPFVKIFDITVSVFLGFLDLIGLFAKIISLSFRLFGNIVSGGVLLTMMIVGLSEFTEQFSSIFGGVSLPIILPLALYLQGLLVACIQAMVFTLLVAIFIRVSQEEESINS